MPDEIKGGCLCGQCQFTAKGGVQTGAHCMCTDCQKVSGTGHITNIGVLTDQLEITGPLSAYSMKADSGNTNKRSFCTNCGTHLLQQSSGLPEITFLHAGTFDDPNIVKPERAVFGRSRVSWDCMCDDVKVFDTMPEKVA